MKRKCPYCLEYFSISNTTHQDICLLGPIRKEKQQILEKELQVRNYTSFLTKLLVLSTSTPEEVFCTRHALAQVPCIITDLQMPVGWTFSHIEQALQQSEVIGQSCASGNHSNVQNLAMSAKNFFQLRKKHLYPLYGMDIPLYQTSLLNDVKIPHFFTKNWLQEVLAQSTFLVLLVGGPSTFVGLHQDICGVHAWIQLVKGKKIYFLFPPESNAGEVFGLGFHFPASLKNQVISDKIRQCNGLVVLLQEGETIFIPSGWWHAVLNLTDTIACGDAVINITNIKAVITSYLLDKKPFNDIGLNMETLLEYGISESITLDDVIMLYNTLLLFPPSEWVDALLYATKCKVFSFFNK